MTNFMTIIELFLAYLLLGLLIRLILSFFPQGIRAPFEILSEFRDKLIKFTQSLFGTQKNFEVNILAIFIFPFIALFFIYSIILTYFTSNTEFQIVNVWLFLVMIFFLAFIPPSQENMIYFRDNSGGSLFIFFSKIFFVLQIIFSSDWANKDFVGLFIMLFPISAITTLVGDIDKDVFASDD